MANTVPLTFRSAPFPEGYRATPEQFKNDLVARLYAESAETIAFIAAGSVAPSSNVGPWIKNGVEWYVWSNSLATYVPQTISSAALGYIAQNATPDHTVYTFWIYLDITGKAQAIKYYSGGAWKDVYEDKFAAYDASIVAIQADITTLQGDITTINGSITTIQGNITTLQGNFTTLNGTVSTLSGTVSALSTNLSTNYSTTTAMNAAIAAQAASTLASAHSYTDAAVAAVSTYPAQGIKANQTIAINGTPIKITFDTTSLNPAPGPFNTANNRYVAPANGTYMVAVGTQFDNATGTASGMEVSIGLFKNGVFVGFGMGDEDSTPSPNGSRWTPGFSGLVQMSTNDYIEVFATINDGVNTGNITLTIAQFSVFRASA